MIDLHLHTVRCGHAEGTLAEYVDAARTAGLRTIAFADHLPLRGRDGTDYAMDSCELSDYVADVTRLAAGRGAEPEILLGIEFDHDPGARDWIESRLRSHPFDVVLGSVHFVDGWAFDDPAHRDRYAQWTPERLWDRYFDVFEQAAASGLYDVMAHPDLVKKFGFVPEGSLERWERRAAEAMAAGGCAVEVNTAGLRKPVGEIYPTLGLLEACRALGVPAVTGSDAHSPGEVGRDIDSAGDLLVRAGYESVVVYRGRRAEEVPLWRT
jgi:histidinol-phosphatase (PHP family)